MSKQKTKKKSPGCGRFKNRDPLGMSSVSGHLSSSILSPPPVYKESHTWLNGQDVTAGPGLYWRGLSLAPLSVDAMIHV